MKKSLKSIGILIIVTMLFQLVVPLTSVFAANRIIKIYDEALYYALRSQLGNKAKYNNSTKEIEISEEELSNITTLDLSNKGITETIGIHEFYNLENLDLSGNNLVEFGAINNLKNLKVLNLEKNHIVCIDEFIELKQLKALNLNDNYDIGESSFYHFNEIGNLEELHIKNTNISSLKWFENMQNLKVLDASKNCIREIPDSIKNIEKVDLSYNLVSVGTVKSYSNIIPEMYLSVGEDNLAFVNCKLENNAIVFDENAKNASVTVLSGIAKGTRIDYSINQVIETKFNDRAVYQRVIENLESMNPIEYEANENDLSIVISKVDAEKIMSLDLSNITDGNARDLLGLENFPNLRYLYLRCSIGDDDIRNLDKLTNLIYLDASFNNLRDLTQIGELKQLQYLDLSDCAIRSSDLVKLRNLKKLRVLDLSLNFIDDVSFLANLEYLDYLSLTRNNISSNLNGIKNLNIRNFSMRVNGVVYSVTGNEFNLKDKIKWIEDTKNPDSMVYTNKNFDLMNCTMDDNFNVKFIDRTRQAQIKINGGNADGTYFTIQSISDYQPLAIRNVEYLNNSSNTACTVTITANKKIKNVLSWDRVNDTTISKTFNYNIKQQIIQIEEFEGSKKENVTINVEGVQNSQIPDLAINYSTLNPTNQDITVTLSSSVDLHSGYHGWVAGEDSKSIMQTFSENTNHTGTTVSVLTEDMFNRQVPPVDLYIEIPNIDKQSPNCTVEYSTQEKTYSSVRAEIYSDEELKLPEGWTTFGTVTNTATGAKRYYVAKNYDENTNETVDVYDLAGNKTSVPISVQNIDKTISDLTTQRSIIIPTNNDVELTINADETISEKDIIRVGSLSNDDINKPLFKFAANNDVSVGSSSVRKTYSQNSDEVLLIADGAGNVEAIPANVSNIDKDAPDYRVEYSNTSNNEIMATIIANEKIENVPGWVLSEDGMKLTRTFNHTRTEVIEIKDLAGNTTKAELKIGENAENSSYNKQDDTQADKVIPQAGKFTIMLILIFVACGGAVIGKKKMKY